MLFTVVDAVAYRCIYTPSELKPPGVIFKISRFLTADKDQTTDKDEKTIGRSGRANPRPETAT